MSRVYTALHNPSPNVVNAVNLDSNTLAEAIAEIREEGLEVDYIVKEEGLRELLFDLSGDPVSQKDFEEATR